MKYVEDFDITPQTPGIMASRRMRAAGVRLRSASAKLDDIDPHGWLADVLGRLPDHPAKRIHDLLPWSWRPQNVADAA
ncbi:transposase domain-containing protein [Bradyrhizobium sp. BWA-3-5]|uniref:transposase domain-containing protein n=1 Tax=Bradyrhizobium sp. BWA-3-5 TaxID=3080013 RepID=UPI00293E81CA|nr:transposase domain-containing protein [Bradyrhizobium sp. BWA-3-5]WOH63906.1 transposase domain-containing protein [Bradyrhizobium sp. BWA-3-5]